MSLLLRIIHFRCFRYYMVITHYYHYYLTCYYMLGTPELADVGHTRDQIDGMDSGNAWHAKSSNPNSCG